MLNWGFIKNLLEQNPDSPLKKNYIICKNPADILHWRILFQENLEKPLLGVEFCPISFLYRRTTEHFSGERIISSRSFLVSLIIEAFLKKNYTTMASKIGIRKNLAEIMDILKWRSLDLDSILPYIKEDFQEKTKVIVEHVFDFFHKHEFKFEGEYAGHMLHKDRLAEYSRQKKTKKENKEVNILWLSPTELNFMQERKLLLVEAILRPSWFIFTEKKRSALHSFFQNLAKKEIYEFEIPEPFGHRKEEDFFEQNRQISLLETSGETQAKNGQFLKIWSADSFYSESQWIANSVYELIQFAETPPTDIHILCKDMKQCASLAYALQERNIIPDAPRYHGSPMIEFISALISILGLDDKDRLLRLDTLFSFLTNPFCHWKHIFGGKKSSHVYSPFYWKKIAGQNFVPKKIALEDLPEYLQILSDSLEFGELRNKKETELQREGLKYFKKTLLTLIDLKKSIHKEKVLKKAVTKFYEEFLKLAAPPDQDIFSTEEKEEVDGLQRAFLEETQVKYQKEYEKIIEMMQRHCFEFAILDEPNRQPLEEISLYDFFYILKEQLKSIPSSTVPPNFSYYSSFRSDNKENSRDIGPIIRPLEEGVYSPCKYLFITGLHVNEPSRESENVFFKEDLIPQEYNIQITKAANPSLPRSQIKTEWLPSLSMVSKGIALSLIQTNERSVDDLVLEIFEKKSGPYFEPEELLEKTPVFCKRLGEPGFWKNTAVLPGSVERAHGFSGLSYLAKKAFDPRDREEDLKHSTEVYENKYDKTRLNTFTGDVSACAPLFDMKHSISYSDFRLLASCPQSYWFKKSLGLHKPVKHTYLYEAENFEKGIWFHVASKLFMEAIIKKYPMLSYCEISQRQSPEQLNALLRGSFKQAIERLAKRLPFLNSLFLENDLKTQERMFTDYFISFFLAAAEKTHQLSGYIPLFAELAFEGASLHSFKFKGSIDRIDYNPEEKILLVCDYKTGRIPKQKDILKNIETLRDIQLPVYMQAALESGKIYEKLEGLSRSQDIKIKGSYIYVKNGAKKEKELLPEALEYDSEEDFHRNIVKPLASHMETLKRVAQKGYAFAVPHREKNLKEGKETEPCIYCAFREICDREPYETAIARLHSTEFASFYLRNSE